MSQTADHRECCNVKRLDVKRIDALLRSASSETCAAGLDEILDEIGFRTLRSLVLRLYVATDIYLAARSFADELGVPDEEFTACFGSADDLEDKLSTVDGTTAFLYEIVEQCIRWRGSTVRDSGSEAVRSAVEYIDRNYMHDDISLTAVACAVGLSPTYLSTIFKRETGQKLSEYLNQVRIGRSKELLCCTSKMIYEIAFEVGFQDYRYFSQIFKKYTGQTPRQFQSCGNVIV